MATEFEKLKQKVKELGYILDHNQPEEIDKLLSEYKSASSTPK